jgi:LacI family transcriptional regulator
MNVHVYRKSVVMMVSITIKDIAKIAGVSHATVSRSLNNSPLAAEETKKRIRELADSLGFEFNANARSLITSRSGTICIIYPDKFGEFGASFYYNSLLNQLREALEAKGMDLIVSFPRNRTTGESNIRRLIISKKIDGVIIVHPRLNEVDEQIVSFMEVSKTPYIFLHHHPSSGEQNAVDIIYTDHFNGGYNAADYLIKLGHKRIMTITSIGGSFEFRQRTEGYRAALEHNGIRVEESLIFYGYRDISSGYNIIKDNLQLILRENITAIFCQTDLMAIGALEALKEFNIHVPEDISIVGYDDIDMLMSFKPNLTTVHQPKEEIAVLACERLADLINGRKRKGKINIVLQTRLIVRESAQSAK